MNMNVPEPDEQYFRLLNNYIIEYFINSLFKCNGIITKKLRLKKIDDFNNFHILYLRVSSEIYKNLEIIKYKSNHPFKHMQINNLLINEMGKEFQHFNDLSNSLCWNELFEKFHPFYSKEVILEFMERVDSLFERIAYSNKKKPLTYMTLKKIISTHLRVSLYLYFY